MVGDGIGFLCSPLQPPQPKPIWAFDSSAESLPKLPKVVVTSVLADVGAQKPEETYLKWQHSASISTIGINWGFRD